MFKIIDKPPAFASRAVGILEGQLHLYPLGGERSIVLKTADGTEIPGVAHERVVQAILKDPRLLFVPVRLLVYPRTEKNRLKIIGVDIEAKGDETSEQNDLFLIQGFNIGCRNQNMAQLGIRPNKRSKHQFEKFWLTMFGELTDNEKCVYRVKVERKGRKLYIIESDPILPQKCLPKKSLFSTSSDQPRSKKELVSKI